MAANGICADILRYFCSALNAKSFYLTALSYKSLQVKRVQSGMRQLLRTRVVWGLPTAEAGDFSRSPAGLNDGPYWYYYQTKPIGRGYYVNGVHDGLDLNWSANGLLVFFCNYRGGIPEGIIYSEGRFTLRVNNRIVASVEVLDDTEEAYEKALRATQAVQRILAN